jgi:hypothetical protein
MPKEARLTLCDLEPPKTGKKLVANMVPPFPPKLVFKVPRDTLTWGSESLTPLLAIIAKREVKV